MSQDDYRKNHTCIQCSQLIDSRDLASMQCGHPFHYQCLQVSLGQQIRKEQYPLCCAVPNCFVEPSMYFLSVVLDEPEFQNYLNLEKNSVQAFQTYQCSSCEQTFLAYPSNKVHKCLKCYKVICLACGDAVHPNKPCQKVSNQEKQCNIETSKSPSHHLSAQPEAPKQIQVRQLSIKKKPSIEIPSTPSAQAVNKDNKDPEVFISVSPKKYQSLRKMIPATPSPMAASSIGSKKNSFVGTSNIQNGNISINNLSSQQQAQPEKNLIINQSRDSSLSNINKNPSIPLLKSYGSRKSFDRMSNFLQQNGEDPYKNHNSNNLLKLQPSLFQQKISC